MIVRQRFSLDRLMVLLLMLPFGVLPFGLFLFAAAPVFAVDFSLNDEQSFLQIIPGVPHDDPSQRITEGSFVLNTWALLEQSPGSYHNLVGGTVSVTGEGPRMMLDGVVSGNPNPASPFRPTLDSVDSPSSHDNIAAKDHITGQLIELVIRDVVYGATGSVEIGQPAELEFRFLEGTIDFSFIDFDRDGERDTGWRSLNELEMSGSPDPLRFSNMSANPVVQRGDRIEIPVAFDIPIEIIFPNDSRVSVEGMFFLEPSTQLAGDFNRDGVLGIEDIDALGFAAFEFSGSPSDAGSAFDLNADGHVDIFDIGGWLNEYGTFPGDANLDRTVQFDDFLVLARSFGTNGVWSNGNFDDDGVVDFTDFLTLARYFGSANATVVPEPACPTWPSIFLLSLLTRCRRAFAPAGTHRR